MDRAAEHVYTPTELNREVKLHLEMGFPRILLEAEVSNLSRPVKTIFGKTCTSVVQIKEAAEVFMY